APDVEAGEKTRLRPRRDDGQPAGLPQVARDLGDDLRRRDAERAREARRRAHGRLHGRGDRSRAQQVRRDLADVEVALVEPGALDGRYHAAHALPDGARILAVQRVARADEHHVRTAAQRLGTAHRRVNSEDACLVVRGRDDAAAVWIAADDERLCPELRVLELLDRSEERVEVEVRDDHTPSLEGGAVDTDGPTLVSVTASSAPLAARVPRSRRLRPREPPGATPSSAGRA